MLRFWVVSIDDDWGSDPEDAQVAPWHEPWEIPEEQPWLLSATDLLIRWRPEPGLQQEQALRDPGMWDHYFQPARKKHAESFAVPQPTEELWDSGAAEGAVDCLFRFIHALERGDIEEAMACVSEEYHSLENDCEIDVRALRLRLESLIDVWQGEDVQLSLSEVPDPVFHPAGILIQITLQVDYRSKILGRKNTELIPGVVVLHETPDSQWLIAAVAPVRQ